MRRRNAKQGYIFVLAIVSLGVMLTVGTAFISLTSGQYQTARKNYANLHAIAMADAGVSYALWRQKYTKPGDPDRDPQADVLPFGNISDRPTSVNVRLLNRSGNVNPLITLQPVTGGEDEADVWVYRFVPDPSKPDEYGYQVISRGYYRRYHRGVRAIFQGDAGGGTGSTGTTAEAGLFGSAFYCDSGMAVPGACNITGDMVVNGPLTLQNGGSLTGNLFVNGKFWQSGGTRVNVQQKLMVKGDVQLDQGGDINGGLLTEGNLTITGGGALNGGSAVNGNAFLGGNTYTGGLKVIGNCTIDSGRNPNVSGLAIVNGSVTINGGGTFNDGLRVGKDFAINSWDSPVVKSGLQVAGSVTALNTANINGGLKTLGNLAIADWKTPTVAGGVTVNGNTTVGGGTFNGTFASGQNSSRTVTARAGANITSQAVQTYGTLSNSTGKTLTKTTPPAGVLPTTVEVPVLTPVALTMPAAMPEIDFSWYRKNSYAQTKASYVLANQTKTITETDLLVTGDFSTNSGVTINSPSMNWCVNGNVNLQGSTTWNAADVVLYVKGNVTIDGAFKMTSAGKVIIVAEGEINIGGGYDFGSTKLVLMSKKKVFFNNNGIPVYAHIYSHNSQHTATYASNAPIIGSVIVDKCELSGGGSIRCQYGSPPYPFLPPGDGAGSGAGDSAWQVASWELLD